MPKYVVHVAGSTTEYYDDEYTVEADNDFDAEDKAVAQFARDYPECDEVTDIYITEELEDA